MTCRVKWGASQECTGRILIRGVKVGIRVESEDETDEVFIAEVKGKILKV